MELPSIFLSLHFLVLITSSSYVQPSTSYVLNNLTDLESLLAFKAHVTDPQGLLATNWTTNTSFCSWFGVYCSRRRQRVTAINLPEVSLQGTISPNLGNLSFLYSLELFNNSLTGPIPESLGHLSRLTTLTLSINFLVGSIPSSILNMSSLVEFYVAMNNLSGSLLPSNQSLIILPRIQMISLSVNSFTGDNVLSTFAQCRDLIKLSLSRNQFSGTIPDEIGSLTELSLLYLNHNQLSETIPTSLFNLTKLGELQLQWNNLTGSIPNVLLNDSMLFFLDISGNELSGKIPAEIGKSFPRLKWFHSGDNQLTGGLEFLSSLSSCVELEDLGMWNNQLQGVLPDSIGNLSMSLQNFYAYDNHIKGSIPGGIGNLSGLVKLNLQQNELTGTIPSTITKLQALQGIFLSSNKLSGSIPFEVGLMKKLIALDLQSNQLSGPIPESVTNLSMLQYLYLSNNRLSSSIPHTLWTLNSLLEIDMSVNSLNGSLSPQVANLKFLDWLDLSMNQLSGNISSHLGELQMLAHLDLSMNSFHNQIPQSFGGMISLTYLNLSHNLISGVIPKSLASLRYLNDLDLSFNKLGGQIPSGGAFSNLNISSLVGNEELCGAPQLHIPPCHVNAITHNSKRKLESLKFILPAISVSVALLTFLYLIYTLHRRRKAATPAHTESTFYNDTRMVSHHEIIRATANFDESNLLGRGGFGSVFRGRLDDGLDIAVKVLNLEVEGASRSFEAECQVLRMVRHRNLIKIITVCSSLDFKALILQFMPNGSLEQWLHSENYCLNLLQRINIMVDVSLALEYLHHHHPHVILHCDLKPTNILLDEEMVAHVGDFGIAKLLFGHSRYVATTNMGGTIGYIAPEFAYTGAVTRMGDVYSFGIILLETFTGKRPVDNTFGEESSLREWVCKQHPDQVLDAVDYKILRDYSSDKGKMEVPSITYRCLSSIIELGLLCSTYSFKERIPMTDVVTRLQKIKTEYLCSDHEP